MAPFYVIPDERLSKLEIDNFIKAAKDEQKQLEILNDIIEHRSNKNPRFNVEHDQTLLHVLASNGFLQGFEMISKWTDNINPQNEKGETPLMFAAWRGHMNVVQFIVDHVPKEEIIAVCRKGLSPIFSAAYRGHQEVFQFLVDKLNDTKLVNRKVHEDLTAIKIAILEGNESLFNAYEPYETDWIQKESTEDDDLTLLHVAVQKQNYNFTKRIVTNLAKHESLDKIFEGREGFTPLHLAGTF